MTDASPLPKKKRHPILLIFGILCCAYILFAIFSSGSSSSVPSQLKVADPETATPLPDGVDGFAQALSAVPGALVCADYQTTTMVFHLYSEAWEQQAQDFFTHGGSTTLRGKAMDYPDPADYGCMLLKPGTPVRFSGSPLTLPIVYVKMDDGSWAKGVTMNAMIATKDNAPPPLVQPATPASTVPADTTAESANSATTQSAVPPAAQSTAPIIPNPQNGGAASAPADTGVTDSEEGSAVNRKFAECLQPKAQYSQYSSYDGGKSAMLLLEDCPNEYLAWTKACMDSGQSQATCSTEALVAAQVALKQFGK